jgi:hypothetical protein
MNDPLRRVLENVGLDASIMVVERELSRMARADRMGMVGWGFVDLLDPAGERRSRTFFGNLITSVGDEYYARRGANVTPGNVPTGMRIGTGSTAVAKSGGGSAIITYESAKTGQKAIDGSFPTCAAIGSDVGWRITWKTTWGTTEGNLTNPIAEVVVTNESPLTDVAGTAANTISRGLVSPTVAKTSADTLAVTWQHDFYDAP